jgi:hypothetical protein
MVAGAVELIRGSNVSERTEEKETKREIPSGPGPERHSLLARLPIKVHLTVALTPVCKALRMAAPIAA